jgi:hypothetical protein
MWCRWVRAGIRRSGLNLFLVNHFLNLGLTAYRVLAKTVVRCDPLAQLVEHFTFNEGVDGSSPSRVTSFLPESLSSRGLGQLPFTE